MECHVICDLTSLADMENLGSVIIVVIEPLCYGCAVIEWGDEDIVALESFEVKSEGREECADNSTSLARRAGAAREYTDICIDTFIYSVPGCQDWWDAVPVILARSTLPAERGDGCLRKQCVIDAVEYIAFGRWGEGPVIGSLYLWPSSFEVVFDSLDERFSCRRRYVVEIRTQGDGVPSEGGCVRG